MANDSAGWRFGTAQVIEKVIISVMLGAGIMSAPALAAPPPPPACALNTIDPTGLALACSGFLYGKLLASDKVTEQQTRLALIGFTWDGNFNQVTRITNLSGATTVDFATAEQSPVTRIYGDTWIGLQFDTTANLGGVVTGFWKLNAGTAGLSSFVLNVPGGTSSAVLYGTGSAPVTPPSPPTGGVPEPASWAMLIAGFGLTGAAMPRHRVAVVSA